MKTTTTIPPALPMGGWKTWASALGLFAIGVFEIVEGNTESGAGRIVLALGLIGIGAKIEKAAER
jgi:hypothetical protein